MGCPRGPRGQFGSEELVCWTFLDSIDGAPFSFFFVVKYLCFVYVFLEASLCDVGSFFQSNMGLETSLKRNGRVFENERFVNARAQFSRFGGSKTMRNMIVFLIEKRSDNCLNKTPGDTSKATKNELIKTVKHV